MDLHRIEGGSPGPVTPAPAPLPGAVSTYPKDVATTLAFLANLIDRTLAVRGVGIGVREFAAGFFGVAVNEMVATSRMLGALEFQLAGLAFAADLGRRPPVAIIGEDQEEPPRWERLRLGQANHRIPMSLAAAFAGGELAPAPMVVQVDDDPYHGEFAFTVYTRLADAAHGEAYLDALLARSRAATNPFRNQLLTAKLDSRGVLVFAEAAHVAAGREDVVLPNRLWAEIDRNVHGVFAAQERLTKAGLACNRGILLAGPPGTGKTAVCRVLASELAGAATVVFCDAAVIGHSLQTLYRELVELSPALVLMEDVDLTVGGRGYGGGGLIDFLLALDGAVSRHRGVVTVATTNNVAGIDAAARRSCRFDVVLDVPPPDLSGRTRILERYLAPLECGVQARVVAGATEGFTGADLRELVSNAVLRAGDGELTTAAVLELARAAGRRPVGHGQYL